MIGYIFAGLLDAMSDKVQIETDCEDVLPVADAGPDMILTLPQDTVTLNGTGSHDGFGISQYKWIKSDSSSAIGNY
uniref:Uncharacterized protein n=1 Tax=Amphimedon queenslandica TaxID=400682 RepID=A0A1X7TJX9_AMPQE